MLYIRKIGEVDFVKTLLLKLPYIYSLAYNGFTLIICIHSCDVLSLINTKISKILTKTPKYLATISTNLTFVMFN
jgi:hypothetical protein